ncbi:MAG: hypothetical protein VKP72_09390 [bacterium]|nr:hypothetical protein [bacterium]
MSRFRHRVSWGFMAATMLLASPAWASLAPSAPATTGAGAARSGSQESAAEKAAKRRAAELFKSGYASDQDFQTAVTSIRNEMQAEIKAGVSARETTVSGMVAVTRWKVPTEAEIREKHERTVENGVNRTIYTVSDYQVDDRNKRVTFSVKTSEQSRPPRIFLFGNEQNGSRKVASYIDILLNSKGNDNTEVEDGVRVQVPPDMEQLLRNLLASMPASVKNTVVGKGKTLALTEMGDILVSNLSTIKVVEADSDLGVQTHGNGFSAGKYTSASIGGDIVIDGQIYDVIATQLASPIALDLDHNGRIDVTGLATGGVRYDRNSRFVEAGSVLFDLLGNGAPVRCEWLKPGHDGLLVDDSTGAVSRAARRDGMITGLQLFGGQRDGNGYAKLARTHGRELRLASVAKPGVSWRQAAGYGPIRGASLASLRVWQDANADGRVQPGELRTCEELGITAINAEYDLVGDERETRMVSWFEQDGQRQLSEDVWFAVAPGPGAAAAPATSKARR